MAAILKNGKLFDVDLNGARVRVQQNPFMKSVAVAREIPDGIAITVTERTPIAALILDRILYLDAEGYVLPPVRSGHMFDLPVITGDVPSADCLPGQQIRTRRLREALEILTTAERIGVDLYHMISEVHLCGGQHLCAFHGRDRSSRGARSGGHRREARKTRRVLETDCDATWGDAAENRRPPLCRSGCRPLGRGRDRPAQ